MTDEKSPVPAFIRHDTIDMKKSGSRSSDKRKKGSKGLVFIDLQLQVKIQSIKRHYDSFTLSM